MKTMAPTGPAEPQRAASTCPTDRPRPVAGHTPPPAVALGQCRSRDFPEPETPAGGPGASPYTCTHDPDHAGQVFP